MVVGILKVISRTVAWIACERFGAECQSIGLAFLFSAHAFIVTVTDAWMLENVDIALRSHWRESTLNC